MDNDLDKMHAAMREELNKKKDALDSPGFMGYLILLCSAMCISAGIIAVMGEEKLNLVSLVGWLLSLFWLLTARAYRQAYRLTERQNVKALEMALDHLEKQEEQEKNDA